MWSSSSKKRCLKPTCTSTLGSPSCWILIHVSFSLQKHAPCRRGAIQRIHSYDLGRIPSNPERLTWSAVAPLTVGNSRIRSHPRAKWIQKERDSRVKIGFKSPAIAFHKTLRERELNLVRPRFHSVSVVSWPSTRSPFTLQKKRWMSMPTRYSQTLKTKDDKKTLTVCHLVRQR